MSFKNNKYKVFLSHGHDEITLLKVSNFLKERLNIETIILKDQHKLGLTIIEKLESYTQECDFAIVLITGDDETKSGSKRARQNVIHEIGFLQGKLSRNRVLLCLEEGVESFSNISGLVYTQFPKNHIESIYEIIRQSIENLNAEPFASSIPAEEEGYHITEKIVDYISKDSSGENSKRVLQKKYNYLIENIAHLDDTSKINRIKGRIETLVKECDEFDRRQEKDSLFEVETETPKNPFGAALGKALVASVNSSIKYEHKIIRELYQDIIYFHEKGMDFSSIDKHLRKVLFVEE